MSLPGWNDLEAVKRILVGIADTTVLFWVLMVLFESSALIWTRRQKLLAGIGFAALVFAVAGEVVGRKYEHRKEALYEEHEAGTARQLNSKIDEANAKAQYAQTLNDAAEKKAAAAKRA